MAILPKSGRAAIAAAIKTQPLHLAVGSGDGKWTTPPAEDASATALTSEIGRRAALEVAFVTPADNGDIAVDGAGTFSRTSDVTNQLYMSFKLDFSDAQNATIREIGVFMGTVLKAGLPAGQMFFAPGDLQAAGTLLQLENTAPIYRSASTRETFEILITF